MVKHSVRKIISKIVQIICMVLCLTIFHNCFKKFWHYVYYLSHPSVHVRNKVYQSKLYGHVFNEPLWIS